VSKGYSNCNSLSQIHFRHSLFFKSGANKEDQIGTMARTREIQVNDGCFSLAFFFGFFIDIIANTMVVCFGFM